MKHILNYRRLLLLCLPVLLHGCQPTQEKPISGADIVDTADKQVFSPAEQEVIAATEQLLIAAGNYQIDQLNQWVSDKAMLGITVLEDGKWINTELTIQEYIDNLRLREISPYLEIISDYQILMSEDRLALVRGDAIVHRYGLPQSREVNNFTMIKAGDQWKFLNISFTVQTIPEEERKFDLDIFARAYAQAWGSQRPGFVASFFAEDGSLRINEDPAAEGRAAIAESAQGFMTDLPDMMVRYDSLITTQDGPVFYWTLIATHAASGSPVNVSGHEQWQVDDQGRIKASQGHFPSDEYARQINQTCDDHGLLLPNQ